MLAVTFGVRARGPVARTPPGFVQDRSVARERRTWADRRLVLAWPAPRESTPVVHRSLHGVAQETYRATRRFFFRVIPSHTPGPQLQGEHRGVFFSLPPYFISLFFIVLSFNKLGLLTRASGSLQCFIAGRSLCRAGSATSPSRARIWRGSFRLSSASINASRSSSRQSPQSRVQRTIKAHFSRSRSSLAAAIASTPVFLPVVRRHKRTLLARSGIGA